MASKMRKWFYVFSFWDSEQSATCFDHWILKKQKQKCSSNKPPKLGLQVYSFLSGRLFRTALPESPHESEHSLGTADVTSVELAAPSVTDI